MLAPMQGVTNRAMRQVQVQIGQPDLVFTEFVRVRQATHHRISRSDRRESAAQIPVHSSLPAPPPLVVQLIGHTSTALAEAAQLVQDQGVQHVNLNMGCPFGRTTSGKTGGSMLLEPELIPECVFAIRHVFSGTFSIKIRAGYADHEQIFGLLPIFADAGVDFLILHPRTVEQKYTGRADHEITRRVVAVSKIPIIANGDVVCAEQGRQLLKRSGAAGLMLGRGAIADPLLFQRIRGLAPATVSAEQFKRDTCTYLEQVLAAYRELFCGDQQVLGKLKAVVACMEDQRLQQWLRRLRRSRNLDAFAAEIK
ncbi:MAG: dihydrouridine synthase [Desulfobacteraceae bacterium 4572_35.1]|nr:MAG: dihydrouridine synthase [Desulfobacteraceae bacterium 4572_35.1]